jgi:hypothetical protein
MRHADAATLEGLPIFLLERRSSGTPHVHVKKGSAEAKVWLDPVRLHVAIDFRGHEINTVVRKVHEQRDVFLRAWHDYFRT